LLSSWLRLPQKPLQRLLQQRRLQLRRLMPLR